MAASGRRSRLYILFLLLMVLLLAGGVALMVYGIQTNGVPAPKLPGMPSMFAWCRHG